MIKEVSIMKTYHFIHNNHEYAVSSNLDMETHVTSYEVFERGVEIENEKKNIILSHFFSLFHLTNKT